MHAARFVAEQGTSHGQGTTLGLCMSAAFALEKMSFRLVAVVGPSTTACAGLLTHSDCALSGAPVVSHLLLRSSCRSPSVQGDRTVLTVVRLREPTRGANQVQ